MTFTRLALTDIARNEFRSWTVFLSATLVAALVLSGALVLNGTNDALSITRGRLGADVLVVPTGSEARVESALLMGTPSPEWMPAASVDEIRDVPGVEAASPQMYLTSLEGASCCSVSNMFIVAFEPASDFTVGPWLKDGAVGDLGLGQAVGGAYVSTPDEGLKLYGYPLELVDTLAATGGNLDQSLFVTFETAREMAGRSGTQAVQPLEIPEDSVSSVLVRTADHTDPNAVAAAILNEVPGVGVVLAPTMFESYRAQVATVRDTLVFAVGLTLTLSVLLIAVVFSMASHERRREIGVWRALGATHAHVTLSFVLQAAILAAAGGLVGAAFAALGAYLFHDYIVTRIGVPFLFPPPATLAALAAGGLVIAVLTASLASLVPAIRASRQDPAAAMRE